MNANTESENPQAGQAENNELNFWDWIWIAATVLSLVAAFALPLVFSWSCDHTQRAGSLAVVFSIILYHYQYNFLYAMKRLNSMAFKTGKQMPAKRKKLQHLATVFLVIGTVIWGYGDLICRCVS